MASRDYYEVLGVAKGASADEIRAGYRKLARQYHPDVNKAADATKRFTEVQQAYDVLSDDAKRKLYDQFGAAAFEAGPAPAGGRSDGNGRSGPHYSWGNVGAPGGSGKAGGGFNMNGVDLDAEDIGSVFEAIFGAGGAAGGGGGRDADLGGGRPAGRSPRSGRSGSRGRATRIDPEPPPDVRHEVRVDFTTVARGGVERLKLSDGGKTQTIEVTIPQGIDDGAQLRVRGAASGRDLILTVRVTPHPLLRRGALEETGKGLDLYLDLPLTIAEATLGAIVAVPTPDGSADLPIPPSTGSGRKLRLRAKGLRDAEGRQGDFYAVIKIVPPTGEIGVEDAQILRRIAALGPAPRTGAGWPPQA